MSRHWISDRAKKDLLEIAFYIKLTNPEAAKKTTAVLHSRINLIRYLPDLGREREELQSGLRSFAVLSYVIFYRKKEDDIVVVRIISGARDLSSIF